MTQPSGRPAFGEACLFLFGRARARLLSFPRGSAVKFTIFWKEIGGDQEKFLKKQSGNRSQNQVRFPQFEMEER